MKLFLRIFLSFWVAAVLMVAFVLALSEFFPLTLFGASDKARFKPEDIVLSVRRLADSYEHEGPSKLNAELETLPPIREKPLMFFDNQGKLLFQEGPPPPLYRELASHVLQSGRVELRLFGRRRLFVFPVHSASGRQYAAVVTLVEPLNRLLTWHFWLRLTIAMIPAVPICLLLSLYLTRPITRLRAAAQRLASGDLDARAMTPGSRRKDELGDLAQDFDVMASQIQSLMTAQRRFVADVSHELGAPLTRMHLALALLRRRFAGEKVGEIERLERETDRLSSLVQQLLLLAGLEAGSRPAETLSPVSIRSLCGSIIDDANFEAVHRGCIVNGSRDDVTLMAYPQLLRRAIDNVLRNAIRYAPSGSEILLNCKVDRDQQQVVLEVLDCGPGVPESMLTDIFRPFFRTAPGRESNSGGTGLGLSIASEAIRLHDGTITARNREVGGLQVIITIPLKLPIPAGEPQPSPEAARA
jgi:two-component system, OmpR family, sensor histidine kinase CpxA